VLLVVHFGSRSGSRALFVVRFSTDSELLIPASASEKALCLEPVCAASVVFDVEYIIAVVPTIPSTMVIPSAITSAIPRSDRNRTRRRNRMVTRSVEVGPRASPEWLFRGYQ